MIIVILGPTAVGKTKLSLALAKKYNAKIINADSVQIYKRLDIGSAKATPEERSEVEHLLIDFKDPKDMYTVYDYQKDVRNILDNHPNENFILVGGTGLYIKAALFDYKFADDSASETYDKLTNEELYERVKEKHPETEIHINNRQRLVRALNKDDKYDQNGDRLLYDAKFIGLTAPRDVLYQKIDNRVDAMIKEGLIDEVKSLYDENIKSKAVMTAIGYKELYSYFDQEISLEEAIALIKQRSRKYAKRQFTWFNNKMNVKWFNVNYENFDSTIDEVINFLDNK